MARQAEPVRVGVVGTGFVGQNFVRTFHGRGGITVPRILTRRRTTEITNFALCDALTNHIDELLANCDVVLECSGDAVYATDVVAAAFDARLPVVTMNAEFHVTAGSYFYGRGLLSEAEGDQPGAFAAHNRFLTEMGFRPLVYCSLKGFLDHAPSREQMMYWSAKQGISLPMVTAFTDGTKVQIEQALVANALETAILEPGLVGPADESYTAAAMRLAEAAQDLGEPVSDYVLCRGAPHGVLIIAEHDTEQAAALKYFKLGEGPFYSLLRPNIFVHLEIPRTIRSIIRGDVLMDNSAMPRISVAAVAKREVAAGERIPSAIGSFEFRGSAVRITEEPGHVPIGLVQNAHVRRKVEPGQIVRFDDIELPDTLALMAWIAVRDRVLGTGRGLGSVAKSTVPQESYSSER
jgi:predicted homoserine dehydrogenase-like protein